MFVSFSRSRLWGLTVINLIWLGFPHRLLVAFPVDPCGFLETLRPEASTRIDVAKMARNPSSEI